MASSDISQLVLRVHLEHFAKLLCSFPQSSVATATASNFTTLRPTGARARKSPAEISSHRFGRHGDRNFKSIVRVFIQTHSGFKNLLTLRGRMPKAKTWMSGSKFLNPEYACANVLTLDMIPLIKEDQIHDNIS